MISEKALKALEYYKVLERVSEFAVLDSAKELIRAETLPESDINAAEIQLNMTAEADKLLYKYAVGGIEFFDAITDELQRASKGSTLNFAELLRVARLLRSSRVTRSSIENVDDGEIIYLRNLAENLYCDPYLENDITDKIISDEQMSDRASETLYQIRKKIKRLNEQVREKLGSYMRGANAKYLQDSIITMRGDRYVVPVKAEFRGQVRGLVHDQSSTGSTLFVEPEQVLELNNELKIATVEERAEIEHILSELTRSVGNIADRLSENIGFMSELDAAYAKATYAYKTRSVRPELNDRGYVRINRGRHPLIDGDKVVPLDVELGGEFKFMIITGPNTGGKTVTLKLVGLFTLMAMSGLFVPAKSVRLSTFEGVFTDIGDEQSIEQSLSTFSSHMNNIVEITSNADSRSLVLLDEIGAGTDPEEGSALAQAVIKFLIGKGCTGITTTHYSKLKEFAYTEPLLKNASMDFNPETFAPLYKLNIGMPGSSNAIEISKRLGLNFEIARYATSLLSENKISFENVLKGAEKSKQEAEKLKDEYGELVAREREEYDKLRAERMKFEGDKQRFFEGAKAESRRIVNEKSAEAEELLEELKEIFDKAELDSGDLINARTIKNKIDAQKYHIDSGTNEYVKELPLDFSTLKQGDVVRVKSVDADGVIDRISDKKRRADVTVGSMRMTVNFDDLSAASKTKRREAPTVHIVRESTPSEFKAEVNVIGRNVDEALIEVETFLDKCVMMNVSEARIVHGVGLKRLSTAIQSYLAKQPRIAEFRFGGHGEGDRGVTVVKFK